MPKRPLGLFSFGVLMLIVAVSLVAWSMKAVSRIEDVLSLVIGSFGVWVIVLSGIRAKSPQKYERGAFSTFVWGVILTTIGGAWVLYSWYPETPVYSLALLLIIIAILAMVAAARAWRKQL